MRNRRSLGRRRRRRGRGEGIRGGCATGEVGGGESGGHVSGGDQGGGWPASESGGERGSVGAAHVVGTACVGDHGAVRADGGASANDTCLEARDAWRKDERVGVAACDEGETGGCVAGAAPPRASSRASRVSHTSSWMSAACRLHWARVSRSSLCQPACSRGMSSFRSLSHLARHKYCMSRSLALWCWSAWRLNVSAHRIQWEIGTALEKRSSCRSSATCASSSASDAGCVGAGGARACVLRPSPPI